MNGINGLDSMLESMPPEAAEMLAQYGFVITLASVLVLGLIALFSYKIFKLSLTIIGALAFGAIGSMFLAPLLINAIGEVGAVNLTAIVGFVCALIGGLLMHFLFKLALFVTGAAGGWFFVAPFVLALLQSQFEAEFFATETGYYVVSAVCALLAAILFMFLFKFLYIVITSVGGMTVAGFMVGSAIMPANLIVWVAFAAIGLIAGIFAAVYQYKINAEH